MKEQNYKNHRRIVPSFHGFTLPMVIIFLVGSIRHFYLHSETDFYNTSLLVLAALILASLYYHTRSFALKVQDRAIRAEEGLRHYLLTGKRMDPRLTLGQIIALRFASDEELPSLAQRAAEKGLKPDEIKREIRNWVGDYRRV